MNKENSQSFVDQFNEAETLFNQNKLVESLKKYGSLLRSQPDHVSVLNNIGLVQEKLGEYSKAADSYQRCHALQPDLVVFIHNLANIYTRLDRWNDALPLLEKIVDKNFEQEQNTEKYALCLFNAKSTQETCQFITQALKQFPDNKRLHRLLGRVLLRMNLHIDGLRHLRLGSGVIEFDADTVRYLN